MARDPGSGNCGNKGRQGLLVTRYGAEMLVLDEAGQTHRCHARRHLDTTVCGDRVRWHRSDQGDCVVTEALPRTNALARVDRYGKQRVLAANIDLMVVITGCAPAPQWDMVDRYLVSAANLPAQCIIVLNKTDLGCDREEIRALLNCYAALGYTVLRTSAATGEGLETLEDRLRGHTSILVGQSGVGKSSLIKALHPELDIRIGDLSRSRRSGRHTTTRAMMYFLPHGGRLIDSPGVRSFEPPLLSPTGIERGFVEIARYAEQCRFPDCTHTVEPGCAVLDAARRGRIMPKRLKHYQDLVRSAQRRTHTGNH